MKEYRRFLKRERLSRIVILLVLLDTCGRILDALSIKSFQWLMDSISCGSEYKQYIYILIIVNVCIGIVYTALTLIKGRSRESAIKKMRDKLYHTILYASSKDLQNENQGNIMTTMSSVEQIVDGGTWFPQCLSQLTIGTMITLLTMFMTDIKLSLLCTLLVLPSGFAFMVAYKKYNNANDDKRKLTKKINVQTSRLSLFGIIKAFANEPYEEKRMFKCTEKYKKISLKKKKYNVIIQLLKIVMCCGIEIIIAIYGIIMIPRGNITIAECLVFYSLKMSLISPFIQVVDMQDDITMFSINLQKYNEMMEYEPEYDGFMNIKEFSNEILFENVGFSYNTSDTVLQDINFTIKKGEKIGIYGKSGGGKSTFVNLINRMWLPTSGIIKIDDMDIRDYTNTSLRKLIGVVSQNVQLFDVSIRDNITYGIKATDSEVIDACKKANAYDFIHNMPDGLDTLVGENGIKLSGGEAQRISLARLFLLDPDIIVLDEATSKLDNESERVVQEAIERLGSNRTVIAIAHRLSTISNFNRVICIDNHHIVEEGNPKELLENHNSVWFKFNNQK